MWQGHPSLSFVMPSVMECGSGGTAIESVGGESFKNGCTTNTLDYVCSIIWSH